MCRRIAAEPPPPTFFFSSSCAAGSLVPKDELSSIRDIITSFATVADRIDEEIIVRRRVHRPGSMQ